MTNRNFADVAKGLVYHYHALTYCARTWPKQCTVSGNYLSMPQDSPAGLGRRWRASSRLFVVLVFNFIYVYGVLNFRCFLFHFKYFSLCLLMVGVSLFYVCLNCVFVSYMFSLLFSFFSFFEFVFSIPLCVPCYWLLCLFVFFFDVPFVSVRVYCF